MTYSSGKGGKTKNLPLSPSPFHMGSVVEYFFCMHKAFSILQIQTELNQRNFLPHVVVQASNTRTEKAESGRL